MPHVEAGMGRSAPGRQAPPARRQLVAVLLCGVLGGCAALTNPVADGLPVRRVPPELLGHGRDGEYVLPLNLLRQSPPTDYRLAADDVIGVWVPGVEFLSHPDPRLLPPINPGVRNFGPAPERGDPPPSVGVPIRVQEDGTLYLPLLPRPVPVQGLTLLETEAAIRRAYSAANILKPGEERVLVTLIRQRLAHILVFRHDVAGPSLQTGNLNNNFIVTNAGITGAGNDPIGHSQTGVGYVVDLPGYDNDVATALALSGGLPGTNSDREVMVYRNFFRGVQDRPTALQQLEGLHPGSVPPRPPGSEGAIIRIPLLVRPGEHPVINPQDIVLHSGDVVFVETHPFHLFYTGGLLPPAEHLLPNDYDLDVVEAILRIHGPLVNGAFGGSSLAGNLLAEGTGSPSPSLLTVLRRTPGGGQIPIRVNLNRALRDPRERILVQPGDVLILQETPGEALVRYFDERFNFTLTWNAILGRRTIGTVTTVVPNPIAPAP